MVVDVQGLEASVLRRRRCVQGHGATDTSGRCRGDAGAGLVGLTVGTLIFLIFLLFACHLLLTLYARSIVAGAAFDGALYVARNGGVANPANPDDPNDPVVTGAEAVVAGQVGASLVPAETFATMDGDFVNYTVTITAPRLNVRAVLPWVSDTITRSARVRIEKPR